MSNYRYRALPLVDMNSSLDWGVVRISNRDGIEALYERGRGPIKLLRWDNYVPSGHMLAKFSKLDAIAYVEYENGEEAASGE